jgi:CheY-like chemotaxis protein
VSHILVVEDEPLTRKAIQKMLSKGGGFNVLLTEDVNQALAFIRAGEVALVLMDVSLTNSIHDDQLIDGLKFTRLIKAEPAARNVPVILATAHTLIGDAERLLAESGADGYIAKPFLDSAALVGKVQAALTERGIKL